MPKTRGFIRLVPSLGLLYCLAGAHEVSTVGPQSDGAWKGAPRHRTARTARVPQGRISALRDGEARPSASAGGRAPRVAPHGPAVSTATARCQDGGGAGSACVGGGGGGAGKMAARGGAGRGAGSGGRAGSMAAEAAHTWPLLPPSLGLRALRARTDRHRRRHRRHGRARGDHRPRRR